MTDLQLLYNYYTSSQLKNNWFSSCLQLVKNFLRNTRLKNNCMVAIAFQLPLSYLIPNARMTISTQLWAEFLGRKKNLPIFFPF